MQYFLALHSCAGKIIDAVDAQIFETRKRLRSRWTRQEDFVLLMCKVASYVLTGLWRKEKFCVPLRVIRDVLHKEHPEVGYAAVAADSLSFVDVQFELGF